jgi:hypothetical protein
MYHSNNSRQSDQWSVFELRQYTLQPGQRDVLIELFDREFVETQEAVGMRVVGQFHDLDRADRFVWVRGFQDMTSRAKALADFYGGPAWKAHSAKANATMIDSDDVLLLRPISGDSGFRRGLMHGRPRHGPLRRRIARRPLRSSLQPFISSAHRSIKHSWICSASGSSRC